MYPLLFHPIIKKKVWGGESWELADLPASIPEGRSTIANGPLAGSTLRQAIHVHHDAIMGGASLTAEGGFPLLVKYLDAQANLSVQVHPDHAWVEKHPRDHLKSEAWVVVNAEPGAVIYKGVKPDVTAAQFARHLAEGTVAGDLVTFEVKPGECHYLPSGTCHALGAGIVVAEVQTPSDTTFRVYDWGRAGRELHVDQALACIAFGVPPHAAEPAGTPVEIDGLRTTPLTKTAYFSIERLEAGRAVRHRIETSGMPEVWMILAGGGLIETPEPPTVPLRPRTTTLLPGRLGDAVAALAAGTELLRITLPSPMAGAIA